MRSGAIAPLLSLALAACSAFVNLDGLHNPVDGSTGDGESDDAGNDGDAASAVDVVDAPVADSSDGSSGVSLLGHAIASFHGSGVTTVPLDATGASLIVAAVCTFASAPSSMPTDSKSNTWQKAASSFGAHPGPGFIQLYFSAGPSTSATQTVSYSTNDFVAISVLVFSGTRTTNVLDAVMGASESTGAQLQVGPVSLGQTNELAVTFACSGDSLATAFAVNSGFGIIDQLHNGSEEDIASAYEMISQAESPTWTFTGDGKVTGLVATFLHL